MIVDPLNSVTGDPRTPLVPRTQYVGATDITEGGAIAAPLDVTFFPHAAAVERTDDVERDIEAGRKSAAIVTPLAYTSSESWLTPDSTRNTFDPATDVRGPHVLAVAMRAGGPPPLDPAQEEDQEGGGKAPSLVVFGDADFASNRYSGAFSNADFLLNAVNWLCRDYALMSIRAKPVTFRKLVVTSRELDFIRYSSWFLLPALVFSVGVVAWWRRR
jgi:hypothetical protein